MWVRKMIKKILMAFALVGLVLISFWFFSPIYIDKDPKDRTNSSLRFATELLHTFLEKKGRYPSADEGLNALVSSSLVSTPISDGWGQLLLYSAPSEGAHGFAYSKGENEQDEHGAGDDIRGSAL